MDRPGFSHVTSRRTFIGLGVIACPISRLLAQTEFWNTKDPTNYSDDEKHRMVNNSPWAKTTHADAPVGAVRRMDGFKSVGCLDCAPKHPKTVMVQASPQREDSNGTLAFYGQVTVRWESANPILQVTQTALPNEFRNHYVISVTGMPVGVLSNASTPLPTAVLSARKGPPEKAEFVALTSDKRTLLFGFPERNPVIKASDKALTFRMDLSGIRIQARFDPKEMIYRGQLAL